MKLGKIKFLTFFIFILVYFNPLQADEKITSVPLINLENLKPSYEEVDEEINDKEIEIMSIKEKKKTLKQTKDNSIKILGLDKITAKTKEINIKIGEIKKFGLLEIKAIKCGKVDSKNEPGDVAYIQVKDLSDNQNEKVFVFNGWTFSSSKSLRPIDHPVYDLWLVGCNA